MKYEKTDVNEERSMKNAINKRERMNVLQGKVRTAGRAMPLDMWSLG